MMELEKKVFGKMVFGRVEPGKTEMVDLKMLIKNKK